MQIKSFMDLNFVPLTPKATIVALSTCGTSRITTHACFKL